MKTLFALPTFRIEDMFTQKKYLYMKPALFTILTSLIIYGCSVSKIETKEKSANEKNIEVINEENKRKAMDSFLNGVNAEAKGDYASAILEYTDAVQLDPKPGIYYSIAKNYFYLNKLSLSLQNIQKAIELEENNQEYLELLQQIYIAAKQFDNAISTLNKLIELDSSNVNAYFQLARLYENNKPLKAIEVYNKVLKTVGSEWNVLIRIAELYERLGMLDKAASSVEEMLTMDPSNNALQKFLVEFYIRNLEFEKAKIKIDEILQFYPDDLEARERKAAILIETNDLKNASSEYQIILEHKNVPFDTKLRIGASFFAMALKDSSLLPVTKKLFLTIDEDSTDWSVKMYLGSIEMIEKNDSIALIYFNKVTELAPWNPDGWIRLGGLLFDNRKYLDAIKILSTAVEKFPEEFAINLILGLAYSQNNDNFYAKKYLGKAAELNSQDITALSALGYTLSQLKENEQAIIFINKALDLDPNNIDLLGTLGLIYDGMEAWAKCDSVYSLALKIDSANALINNNYAYSLSKRGERLTEALNMITLALEKEPNNSSYLDTKGWVFYKMKEYQKAKDFINRSLEVGGEKSVILDHLGDVLFMLGQKEEAVRTWNKAFELDKANKSIKIKIDKGEL